MNDELHALSGAYAVHALPYAERARFEAHLPGCPACAAEIRHLRETAARLAETAAEPPPPSLRPRLLATARTRRSLAEGEAALLGEEERGPRRRRRQGRGRVPAGVAAIAVAAAVALGVLALDARRDLGELTARNAELAAVLAAPDAETVRRPATSGGTGTVVISRAMGRMVFASSGLPELPVGRTYELWLMGPDGPRPAGLLGEGGAGDGDGDGDGTTTPVVLPAGPGDGHVALTVEPAGGSDSPTTLPVLLAALPGA
ncbi:anti-sigma factor domain-containing protein [Nonomuraea terrae]|uniref:anti-sigma factor n=1 Tax=Nonomuraea terrae TaxID=2530383 RepID=UPI0037A95BE5